MGGPYGALFGAFLSPLVTAAQSEHANEYQNNYWGLIAGTLKDGGLGRGSVSGFVAESTLKTFLPASSELEKVGRDSFSQAIVTGAFLGKLGFIGGSIGPWLNKLTTEHMKLQNQRNNCECEK